MPHRDYDEFESRLSAAARGFREEQPGLYGAVVALVGNAKAAEMAVVRCESLEAVERFVAVGRNVEKIMQNLRSTRAAAFNKEVKLVIQSMAEDLNAALARCK